MKEQEKKQIEDAAPNQDRRKAIKKIAVGVGVLAGYSVLPKKWIQPIVGQVVLPAHAATSGTVPTAAPTATPVAAAPGEYNSSETYTMKKGAKSGGKYYTWLNHTGSYYGGPIKFVFGCGELHVPDARVTHGADGNRSNHNQAFYFCGTDFKPGVPEYNAGLASVFAPPGCGSNRVTVYFNK